jgi:rRNA maturation endonuclease Nob1
MVFVDEQVIKAKKKGEKSTTTVTTYDYALQKHTDYLKISNEHFTLNIPWDKIEHVVNWFPECAETFQLYWNGALAVDKKEGVFCFRELQSILRCLEYVV